MRPKTYCSIEGCSRVHEGRGYCSMHYRRLMRTGSPTARRSLANGERMKWLKQFIHHDGDECVIPPFAKEGESAASVYLDGVLRVASRAMCILAHGEPASPDLHAAHSCGNGHLSCCNPKHIRWATVAENAAAKHIHGTATVGEKSHHAKLTLAEAQWVWDMRGTVSQSKLAKELGVSRAAISHIHVGRNWPEIRRESL